MSNLYPQFQSTCLLVDTHFLVGDFNPPEKWWSSSDWIIIPNLVGENKTHVPNHQPAIPSGYLTEPCQDPPFLIGKPSISMGHFPCFLLVKIVFSWWILGNPHVPQQYKLLRGRNEQLWEKGEELRSLRMNCWGRTMFNQPTWIYLHIHIYIWMNIWMNIYIYVCIDSIFIFFVCI